MQRVYEFGLTGRMPLIMHADNIQGCDNVKAWRDDPANKNLSVPGDDRSPPWTYKTYLHVEEGHVVMPQECVMTCVAKAANEFKLKGNSKFGRLFAASVIPASESFEFRNRGKAVDVAALASDDDKFEEHEKAAKDAGFSLFVKRAKVGTSKHIRVRPRFDQWTVSGSVFVTAPEITKERLTDFFETAGARIGLGDWRPSAPMKPGPFGTFSATVMEAG